MNEGSPYMYVDILYGITMICNITCWPNLNDQTSSDRAHSFSVGLMLNMNRLQATDTMLPSDGIDPKIPISASIT